MRKQVSRYESILTKMCSRRILSFSVPLSMVLFISSGCEWNWGAPETVTMTRYYTITFNGNGNTSGSAPAPIQAVKNSSIMLPGQGSMIRDGYILDGWQTTSSGYKSIGIDDDEYHVTCNYYGCSGADIYTVSASYTVIHNDTLYARWVNHTYDYVTFTDNRDNKTYKAVKIGDQIWMAENLNYQTPDSSWCYDNSVDNCNKYGRLYAWNTAMAGSSGSNENPSGIQGICPDGWHLPSKNEWSVLRATVGILAGIKLKDRNGWGDYNKGTNEYGFSALPCDIYFGEGSFGHEWSAHWWTTTENNGSTISISVIYRDNLDVDNIGAYKKYGLSVRCLQN